MKHATGLISRIICTFCAAGALSAECVPLAKTDGAIAAWGFYTSQFGPAEFPRALLVCTGSKFFHEVKNGAGMLSALDRKKMRILRREEKAKYILHELAHVYLDIRWQVLPYSISEPLAASMEKSEKCPLPEFVAVDKNFLAERWAERDSLPHCEMVRLLRDVFYSEADIRLGLLLR